MATLLIVDDDPGIRALVRATLERDVDEIFEADNAADALALARGRRPDLLLLDVELPGGPSGLAVCRMIKDDPASAGITVVMLTAKAKEWDHSWGEEAGADDYVTKPFSPGELRERVSDILGRLRG